LASDVLTCCVGMSETGTASTDFADAEPPSRGDAEKAVERTVKNFTETDEGARTVAMALPA